MAKIKLGPMVGQASGSIGATVFSRNRYGTYTRRRAIPVQPGTTHQLNARSRLAALSQSWQSLTDAQRLDWLTWAQTNPITDVLGDSQVLSAHAAYISLNARLLLMGTGPNLVPPVIAAPNGFGTASLIVDVATTKVELTYAPSPTGAAEKLWLQACLLDSQGIVYVNNLLRTYVQSGVAQASPYNSWAVFLTRFGTPQANQKVVMYAHVVDATNGQLSPPFRLEAIVT